MKIVLFSLTCVFLLSSCGTTIHKKSTFECYSAKARYSNGEISANGCNSDYQERRR